MAKAKKTSIAKTGAGKKTAASGVKKKPAVKNNTEAKPAEAAVSDNAPDTVKQDLNNPEALKLILGLLLDALKFSRNLSRISFGMIKRINFSWIKIPAIHFPDINRLKDIKLPEVSLNGKPPKNIVVKLDPPHFTPTEAKDESIIMGKLGEALSGIESDDENLVILDMDSYFREIKK